MKMKSFTPSYFNDLRTGYKSRVPMVRYSPNDISDEEKEYWTCWSNNVLRQSMTAEDYAPLQQKTSEKVKHIIG